MLLVADGLEKPMKNWRNNQPNVDPMESILSDAVESDLENKLNNINNLDSINLNDNDNILFQQNINDNNEETFNISMYILVILTLFVIILFFNWYRKGRNNVRTRRKYFLLSKLGF